MNEGIINYRPDFYMTCTIYMYIVSRNFSRLILACTMIDCYNVTSLMCTQIIHTVHDMISLSESTYGNNDSVLKPAIMNPFIAGDA
mgnify:FL=1